MLLYYPFWMFMGFTLHLYIIFGTNLLTGGPARIAAFLPILVFRRKGISNEVQTEWNLRERSFWNKRNPGDLEWTSRSSRGGHEAGGRALRGWACPPTLVALLTYLLRLYISTYPKNIQEHHKITIFTAATFYIRKIPSWSLRRRSAGGGIDHRGLLHQHHSLFDELWVVYQRPSSP